MIRRRMPIVVPPYEELLKEAVAHYWRTLESQKKKQKVGTDHGNRSSVTGGKQLDGFCALVQTLLVQNGLGEACIYFKSQRELRDQVAEVTEKLHRVALVEEFIEGDEVDVSILGNEERVKVLPLSRSTFEDLPEDIWHIYPFEAKWSSDSVYKKIKTERPAKYSQKLTQLISEICLDAYNLFDCHDYARIEVRVDKAGNPFILEINPNPSINQGDCVPACAELIGLGYEDFILEILREVVLRYRARPPYYHLQSALVSL